MKEVWIGCADGETPEVVHDVDERDPKGAVKYVPKSEYDELIIQADKLAFSYAEALGYVQAEGRRPDKFLRDLKRWDQWVKEKFTNETQV